ncbi:MAG: phosphoribosylglycinamide formyltransferase [Bdellovibrionaceae bacterium]|nr:phosphoribosylglycinamide formyltransferase [Pseudobdellovibrionaceae bacterium]|tara:strand:+ start:67 stop:711 length:645 start_codon:yes stop_codon:yes gene_type:complete
MKKIAIFASGRGSNFDAIAEAIEDGRLIAQIYCVISDQKNAPVLEKAKKRGIKTAWVPFPLEGALADKRKTHADLLIRQLKDQKIDWIVLAGWMRILHDDFITEFMKNGIPHIVNIHPSLLPAFPGKKSYEQAFDYGCSVTGVTVHLVTPQMDDGPICAQESFRIEDKDSLEQVESKGLRIEHQLYPKVLAWLFSEQWKVISKGNQGRVCVRSS